MLQILPSSWEFAYIPGIRKIRQTGGDDDDNNNENSIFLNDNRG